MRKKNLLLAATLLINLPPLVLAQGSDKAGDEAAIRQIRANDRNRRAWQLIEPGRG